MSDGTTADETIAGLTNDLHSLQVAYELNLPPEHLDALVGGGDKAAKIELGQRLAAGQPQQLAAAAPAASPAQSQARAPRDAGGRFTSRPAGFGGGVAPSGQPFNGHPPGEHPADAALRTAAGF